MQCDRKPGIVEVVLRKTNGTEYRVSRCQCTCRGFETHKHCKHVDAVGDLILRDAIDVTPKMTE
ncbi:SWIM zinc finger family protein, partial [Staphylococcus aureus]